MPPDEGRSSTCMSALARERAGTSNTFLSSVQFFAGKRAPTKTTIKKEVCGTRLTPSQERDSGESDESDESDERADEHPANESPARAARGLMDEPAVRAFVGARLPANWPVHPTLFCRLYRLFAGKRALMGAYWLSVQTQPNDRVWPYSSYPRFGANQRSVTRRSCCLRAV
jgi:hypothetical protein